MDTIIRGVTDLRRPRDGVEILPDFPGLRLGDRSAGGGGGALPLSLSRYYFRPVFRRSLIAAQSRFPFLCLSKPSSSLPLRPFQSCRFLRFFFLTLISLRRLLRSTTRGSRFRLGGATPSITTRRMAPSRPSGVPDFLACLD